MYTKTLLQQLEDKFTIGDGCWEWTAATAKGYGRVRQGNKQCSAHVVMYELMVGPIAIGLELDHLCRNTRCVRPDHLEPVTHAENLRRGVEPAPTIQRRSQTHCVHGHEFTEQNTIWRQVGAARCRRCRACGNAASRRYRQRKVA